MARDMEKIKADYWAKFGLDKRPMGRGVFTLDDCTRILDMSATKQGEGFIIPFDPLVAVGNALEVGYMVGYRAAQREARRKRAENKAK